MGAYNRTPKLRTGPWQAAGRWSAEVPGRFVDRFRSGAGIPADRTSGRRREEKLSSAAVKCARINPVFLHSGSDPIESAHDSCCRPYQNPLVYLFLFFLKPNFAQFIY